MDQMVQLKIYSFQHYLRKISFKGFSKWCVLNQAFKELHPKSMNLFDIIKKRQDEKGAITDKIYQTMTKHF